MKKDFYKELETRLTKESFYDTGRGEEPLIEVPKVIQIIMDFVEETLEEMAEEEKR